ncbi:FAD:protein FMN transferase [Runella slithyformis]|uniref:FAD:protein FMN transferase n=1 Tax=Runella slithyformis (strain ATCC 29530 / DSM 19594 / LMG 11500 / NCIMB 11436 / LSU 4) TaxID=761193 RepID=A0A7U4E846_RUNSL|nr:FAD:protein FMN transferase [Runella slithyformis]AEI50983.1 ApbE family lipoprotein [Runella slithyformis DSM 19594]
MNKLFVVCLVSSVVFSACEKAEKEYQKITGKAQGTTYAITFKGQQRAFSAEHADSIFQVIDRSMSLWDSTSGISRFNKITDWQEVDEHFQNVLRKSMEVHRQSSGAFDPTIGPLSRAWGFIRTNDLPLPDDRTIDSLKQFIGLEKVMLDGNRVTKQHPAIQLDFNAIAQGYTVDVIAAHLENKGILNYLIEVGGEVRARGKNSKGEDWKVGIEKPIQNETGEQNELHSIVSLGTMSLATSGNYRNFLEMDGKQLSHILNPTTGKPVAHSVVSVSVLAPTCTEADAWATAFTVVGKDKSLALAKQLDFELQIVFKGKQGLEVVRTEGFKKQLP